MYEGGDETMDLSLFSLEGKTALVTGVSRGLGQAMAVALAKAGADIVGVGLRGMGPTRALVEAEGRRAYEIHADLGRRDAASAVAQEAVAAFGRVDILVNNAGTGAVAPAVDITDEQFNNELKIDLFGSFICAREFAKEMLKRKYGRIINIASMYGLVGNMAATCAPYHAAKGGVVNLTRALAAEWGKDGITVNSICPGYFWTPLTKDTLETDWFAAYAKGAIPLGRYGKEGELDTCALFLASPASSYVNGQNIAVDGGYTAI